MQIYKQNEIKLERFYIHLSLECAAPFLYISSAELRHFIFTFPIKAIANGLQENASNSIIYILVCLKRVTIGIGVSCIQWYQITF